MDTFKLLKLKIIFSPDYGNGNNPLRDRDFAGNSSGNAERI